MTKPDKRKTILRSLEKVLKDRRFDEITVDEVAEDAGVGKGTVYRYFIDKENLFFEMARNFLTEEIDDVMVVAASSLSPHDKLIRIGEEISRHMQNRGEYLRMMPKIPFSATNKNCPKNIMAEHHQRLDRILIQLLQDAEQSGVLRPGIDHDAITCIYKGMIMSRSMRPLHGQTDIPVAELVNILLEGISRKD